MEAYACVFIHMFQGKELLDIKTKNGDSAFSLAIKKNRIPASKQAELILVLLKHGPVVDREDRAAIRNGLEMRELLNIKTWKYIDSILRILILIEFYDSTSLMQFAMRWWAGCMFFNLFTARFYFVLSLTLSTTFFNVFYLLYLSSNFINDCTDVNNYGEQ